MKKIDFKLPLSRPHCGIALGNGRMGVLVWGGGGELRLTINRADFWDHRNGELIPSKLSYRHLLEFARQHGCGRILNDEIKAINDREQPEDPRAWRPQRLPFGRIDLILAAGAEATAAELALDDGGLRVFLSDGSQLTFDMLIDRDILVIGDPGQRIQQPDFHPAWDFPQSREWLEKYGFEPPQRFPDGWRMSCPADPALTVKFHRCAGGWVVAFDDFSRDQAPPLEATRAWWRAYYEKLPVIKLPDESLLRLFYYSAYKFAAATNPHGCACGLQGPWHEEYQRAQWSGDFHFNVNVQEIYSPAGPLGAPGHLLPLFDMIESAPFTAALRHNARSFFGIDDGLWFTHAVDDRGRQCGWLMCGSMLDPACGTWTALLYWDYFRYTGDLEFLRRRAFPFMRGVMRCLECMLDADFNIPLAISAEYASSNSDIDVAGRNPSYQLAGVRRLAAILLECCVRLGETPKPVWRKILERVPPYSVVGGLDRYSPGGTAVEPRIAIWENQDLEVCHRHHSHLGCILPFDSLPPELSRAEYDIIDNSIDHWIAKGFGQWSEWCVPWAVGIMCRMGFREAPVPLLSLWRNVFVNEGMTTVYLPRFRGLIAHRRHDIAKPRETSEVMQLDGSMGFISALLDMFAYQRGDTVHLFQGIPESWREAASIENLHLPGGFTLSADASGARVEAGWGRPPRLSREPALRPPRS